MSLLRSVLAVSVLASSMQMTEAAVTAAGLPTTGRCTAANFGGSDGLAAVIPSASLKTQLGAITVTKGTNTATLSFTGAQSLFGSDNIGNLTGANEKRVFETIWRCDENSVSGSAWTTISTLDGSLRAVASGAATRSFVDSFTGVTPVNSKYWYIAMALVASSDSPAAIGAKDLVPSFSDAATFTTAQNTFFSSTTDTSPTWSDPRVASVSFLPVQNLAISASNGFGSGTTVTAAIGGASVGYTLTATIDATLVSSPTYVWTSSNLPTGLTATANANQLTVSGSFTTPGVFNTSVTATVATSHTTSSSQTFVVTPAAVAFVTPAAALGSVQVSRATTYTLVTTGGMHVHDSTNYEVVYTVTAQPASGTVAISGAAMTVDMSQVSAVGTNLSFTVQAAVQCKTGGTCDSRLLSSTTRTFTAVTANEFKFAQTVQDLAAGLVSAPTNLSNYAQIRHGSGQASYDIGVTGAGATFTTTMSFIGGALSGGGALANIAQIGLEFVAQTSGATAATIRETSALSSLASTGATFVLEFTVNSPNAQPNAIITTRVGFVVLDGVQPMAVATPMFDAFAWGVAGKQAFLPTSVNQTLRVTYNKNLSVAPAARIMFSNGTVVTASGTIGNPANTVTYSVSLSAVSTAVAPTTSNNSLAVMEISLDTAGRDVQAGALSAFANATVAATYGTASVSYFAVNPLKAATTNLGTNVSAVAGLTVALNKLATVAAGAVTGNLGSLLVNTQTVSGATQLAISPVTRYTYGGSGLTLVSSQITDSDGLPLLDGSNVAQNTALTVTVEADTYRPALVSAVQRSSSADSLSATFTAVFDENLNTTCTANVTPAAGVTSACTVAGNQAAATLSGLSANTRYELGIAVSDAANNATTVAVTYATLSAQDTAAPANTAPPFVLALTPDLRDSSASAAVNLLPVVQVKFSESVSGGTLALFQGSNAVASTTTGSGNFRSLTPNAQLNASTTYRLEVSGFTGSNGAMTAVTYAFNTVAAGTVFAAPTFTGSPVTSSLISRDDSLVFYFSEPLKLDSLTSGFTLTATGGVNVVGQWVSSGRAHTFKPSTKLAADTTYTYTFSTAVRSINGVALANPATGTFTSKGAFAPGEFAVNVNPSGASYTVTAAWLPGDETSGSYRLSLRTATGTSFSGAATVLTTSAVTSGAAKVVVTAPFTAVSGQNAEFTLEVLSAASAAVATARAFVFALPSATDTIKSLPVSIVSGKVSTLALDIESGNTVPAVQLKIDPAALKTSANIQVQTIGNATTLNALAGGGQKVASPVQFGPDGKQFLVPVEVGMRFNPTQVGGGTAAELLNKVNPLVLSPASSSWGAGTLGKSRVEVISATEAVIYFLTSHFSVYSVGQALLFNTVSGNLSLVGSESVQQTATVSWNAPVADADVTIAVAGTSTGVTTSAIRPDGSSSTMTGILFTLPFPVTSSISAQYTVSLRDSGTTTSATFNLVREATGGNPSFSGNPRNVDTFTATLSSATQAVVTWTLTSDTTDRQIDRVLVEVAQRMVSNAGAVSFSTPVTYSFVRSALTTSIAGLTSGATYRFRASTQSQAGTRSLATAAIDRYTYGFAVSGIAVGAGVLDTLAVTVTGSQVNAKRFSTAELTALTGTGAILISTTTLSNGATLLQTGLFDFGFTGAGSVAVTIPGTFASYAVYHFDAGLNSGLGGWELLLTPALAPNATLNATVAGVPGSANSLVTIQSKGIAGSPFALAIPPAATVRADSGGCLSVAGAAGNPVHGLLNFMFMLLPVTLMWIKSRK